ncbi:MAG: hypothetical protein JWO36_1209 [Myxococcales bacterium]|nr:hypothetical protein [Myxococcales bacterium]
MKLAAVLVVVLIGAAHADPPPKPDPLAEDQAREANLESIAPREGVTFSGAIGGSLFLGSGAVGKGGAISLRLGHVATPNVVLTFELAGGAFLHSVGGGKTLQDGDGNLLAGAQYYANPSLWIRGAGGFGIYTKNEEVTPNMSKATTRWGPAAAFGAGIDLVRKRFWVLGIEVFTVAKVHRDGVLAITGLCLGLSHY